MPSTTYLNTNYFDLESGSLELEFPQPAGATTATLTGNIGSVVKAPSGGNFTWSDAELVSSVGVDWNEVLDLSVTIGAVVYDYKIQVKGDPACRVTTAVDGVIDAHIDFLLDRQNNTAEITWGGLYGFYLPGPIAGTLAQIVLDFGIYAAGDSVTLKNASCGYSDTFTLDGNGRLFLTWIHTDAYPGGAGISQTTTNALYGATGFDRFLEPGALGVVEITHKEKYLLNFTIGNSIYDAGTATTVSPFEYSGKDHDGGTVGPTAVVTMATPGANIATYVPTDDSYIYDYINISYNSQGGVGAPSISLAHGILDNDKKVIELLSAPLAGAVGAFPFFGFNSKNYVATFDIFKFFGTSHEDPFHLRNEEFKTYIGESDFYMTLAPSAAPIVLAYYDSAGASWHFSTSEPPGLGEYSTPLLVPGAHAVTVGGGHTVTHWAVIPLRGRMSALYWGETVDCTGGTSTPDSQTVQEMLNTIGFGAGDWTDGMYAAVFVEATVNWQGAGAVTINVDPGNLIGLGTDTYTLTIT